MNPSRRRVLRGCVAAGATSATGVAGCLGGGPDVASVEDAPGAGGGPSRYGYTADGLAVPERPQLVVGHVATAADLDSTLAASAHELLAQGPLSDAVGEAVALDSTTAFAKVSGARVFVGVQRDRARTVLSERGEEREYEGVSVFEGEDWTAAVTDDAVVEAAAPLANDELEREQYPPAIVRAAAGDGPRLLEADAAAGRVAGALPESEYLEVTPGLSELHYRAEAFGVSFRGDRALLALARLSVDRNDPSKRNARLDTVERWQGQLTPDASVSNVSVEKRGNLVRVTGTVPSETVTLGRT